MLNRPATKIELNIEDEIADYEECKNARFNNPIEFEKLFKTDEILKLLPNYYKEINSGISNNNISDYKINEFNPHEFNFSDDKSDNIKEFNINNSSSPKEFNLGDVTIQEPTGNNKSDEKQMMSCKLFSTPDNTINK